METEEERRCRRPQQEKGMGVWGGPPDHYDPLTSRTHEAVIGWFYPHLTETQAEASAQWQLIKKPLLL